MTNFDGKRFHNLKPETQGQSIRSLIKWIFTRNKAQWPSYIQNIFDDIPPTIVKGKEMRVSFIGHASFLVQTEGVNILMDPVFSERASFVSFAGPKRVSKPGISMENLPKIDIVLVSHNHYDHMDVEFLTYIANRDNPLIVLPKGNEKIMQKISSNTAFLSWGESYQNISLEPAQHWSSRNLFDRNKSLWGTFIMSFKAGSICFIGDTGYDENIFKDIAKKYTNMRLAIIPIGSYEPRWFMQDIHVNPEEAVKIHMDLKSKLSLGSHFGTFQLSDEAYEKPEKDLKKALEGHSISSKDFKLLKIGQSLTV